MNEIILYSIYALSQAIIVARVTECTEEDAVPETITLFFLAPVVSLGILIALLITAIQWCVTAGRKS